MNSEGKRSLDDLNFVLGVYFVLFLLLPLLAQERNVAPVGDAPGQSQRRIALVIGNDAYSEGKLLNPANDAHDIGAALKSLNFIVEKKLNVQRREMLEAINRFGEQLKDGGVGLFFYAGHGIQVKGRNYLIPIGAAIETEQDVEFEAVDVGRILGKMEHARNRLNILILDACRNNPFARNFRSFSRGLAQMVAPNETFIAYATAPGEVAADGSGRNSPYTTALLSALQMPGLDIMDVFQQAARTVKEATDLHQRPWVAHDVTQAFYFIAPLSPPDQPVASTEQSQLKPTPGNYRPPSPRYNFRSVAKTVLTGPEVKQMLKKHDFYWAENNWSKAWAYPGGRGIFHDFEAQTINGDTVIVDHATGLMWQQSGSDRSLVYKKTNQTSYIDAELYIAWLNDRGFAGYSDWRLPTLEEAMSLVEQKGGAKNDLYINPLFDAKQREIWTADRLPVVLNNPANFEVWYVDFDLGLCDFRYMEDYYYVRAVRSR